MEFLIALAIFIPVMAVIVGGTAAIHALGWCGLLSPRTVRKIAPEGPFHAQTGGPTCLRW
jgi:hypothetical protein